MEGDPITTKDLYWLERECPHECSGLSSVLIISPRYLIIAIAFYVHPDAVDAPFV